MRGDDRPGIAGGGVEADTEAGGRAVSLDGAEIGGKVIGRILGGDPALDRVTAQLDILLALDARSRDRRACAPEQCESGPAPGCAW